MTNGVTRLDTRFAQLAAENRKAFVAFLTAGDPDVATSAAIIANGVGVVLVNDCIRFRFARFLRSVDV